MVSPQSSMLTYVHPAPFLPTSSSTRSHPSSAYRRRPIPVHKWHSQSVPGRSLCATQSLYLTCSASNPASSTPENNDPTNDDASTINNSSALDEPTHTASGEQPRSPWTSFKSWFPTDDSSRDDVSSPMDSQPQRKRVQHSDSKPGASFGLDDSSQDAHEPVSNISIQERWKDFIQVIVPNRQNLTSTVARIESNESEAAAEKEKPKSTPGAEENNGHGGIFELYKPPSETKKRSPVGSKPWFTPPWGRDSTKKAGTNESLQKKPSENSSVLSSPEKNNLMAKLDTSASESESDCTPDDSSDRKDWFTPPWKRQRQQKVGETSSDLTSGNNEPESLSIGETPNGKSSASTELPTETSAAESPKKVKVTYPSKKPWFRWPGAQQNADNSDSDRKESREVPDVSDVSRESRSVSSEIHKRLEDISSTEASDEESEQPKTSKNDSDAEDNNNQKAPIERKHERLVTASVRSSLDSYSIPQRDISQIRQIFGSETFFATDTIPAPGGLLFHGNLRGEPQSTVDKLEERLSSRFGDKYTLCLAEGEDQGPVVVVVPTSYHQLSVASRHRLLAIGLAFLTISTCMSRGLVANVLRPRIIQGYGFPETTTFLTRLMFTPVGGSTFVAVAIGLLVVMSQIVRRVVASWYRTKLAMPFMLPSYQLGSFGAVVYLVSPAPNRAALFDIAISSATAMLVPAMICLIIGLRLSTSFASVFPVPMSMVSGSLIMGFLTRLVPNGQILVDYQRSLIGLHPLAIIGANCLTIAALNLLPIRQLDGSRIVAAIFGRKAALRAWRISVLYLLFASSKNPYLIMFLLIVSFGPWQVDRPSRNELTEPDNVRTIIGYLFMLLMIGLLLPYPKSSFFGTL